MVDFISEKKLKLWIFTTFLTVCYKYYTDIYQITLIFTELVSLTQFPSSHSFCNRDMYEYVLVGDCDHTIWLNNLVAAHTSNLMLYDN